MCSSDIILGLLAILFPPIAVWIKVGLCSADSVINILLCMLGYLPGLIHAWYIISLYPEPDYSDYEVLDPEAGPRRIDGNGRVTYYYVQQRSDAPQQHTPAGQQVFVGSGQPVPQRSPQQQQQQQRGAAGNGQVGYGTVVPSQQQQQQPAAGSSSAPEAEGVPPSYEQAIRGDNKIQR